MHRLVPLAVTLALGATPALAAPVDDARALYLQGDCDAAVAIVRPLAEAGDADAQNILGRAHDDGCGAPADPADALDWWTRSADQGFARAIFNLGVFWENGRPGYPADPAQAETHYRRAIALDHPDAFASLGRMLMAGAGIPADPAEAAALLERGHELGSVRATAELARAYRDGTGVAADDARAVALFREAAFYDLPIAVVSLGEMYQAGRGVPSDPLAAFALYNRGLELADESAALNLAYLVTFSEAYFRNPVYGHALCLWYIEGAAPEDRARREGLCDEVRNALDPDELIAAKALFSTW